MSSFYEQVGGEEFFTDLVSQFYARVANDPILRPMYPADDLKAAAERLRRFLEQYWGGPTTYQETRGHPRLRIRHAQFHIDSAARDAWLGAIAATGFGSRLTAANPRLAIAPDSFRKPRRVSDCSL